jgi:hypothetical protein
VTLMVYAPDGLAVVLNLLRDGLGPDVQVFSRMPDHFDEHMPMVLIHRSGGQSKAPKFYDSYLLNVQCWAGGPGVPDPALVTYELADDIRRILWEAVLQQQTTPDGWLIGIRESSAPQELPENDQPLYSRFVATYELHVRHQLVA